MGSNGYQTLVVAGWILLLRSDGELLPKHPKEPVDVNRTALGGGGTVPGRIAPGRSATGDGSAHRLQHASPCRQES